MSLTLNEARKRLRMQLPSSSAPDPLPRPSLYGPLPAQPGVPPSTVTLSIGAHTAETLRSSAYDKRTGEWKARSWGGRRTSFTGAPPLYDHHLGKDGERLGRRKQESNFFITINTNRRKFGPGDMRACAEAVRQVFGPGLYNQLRYGPRQTEYEPDAQWPSAVIENVKVTGGVERGPHTGSLHAHVHCRIVHWSQIQIDTRRLQWNFKDEYNARADAKIPPAALPSIQVKLQQQSDWNAIIADYLSKSAAAFPSDQTD